MGPVKFIYGSPNDYFHDDASTSTLFVVFVKYPFRYAKFDYMMRQVPLPSSPETPSTPTHEDAKFVSGFIKYRY